MGITGLLPFLQKCSKRANIKEYSGATVAIDAYCWLHKGAFACAEKLVLNEPTTLYVSYCMKYVNMLLSHNIKPILVFDGQNLPAKAGTELKRRQSRDTSRRKGLDLIRAGRVAEGRNVLRRSLDVTHEMALELIRECRRRNVDCIVAPYEADAQLAYLSIEGIAHVIITEDSDLMLFGCKTVMFKMDINGNGVVIESAKLHLSMGIRQDLFTLDKFRLMCILSGCDYIESLPGIGLAKACKFVTKTSEPNIYHALEKLPSNLNMWTLEVPEEYRQGVVSADRTFRCQLVFDPIQRRLVPLTQPREGEEVVGEVKDSATAMQMALGNVNPRDLRCLDDWDPDKIQTKPRSRAEEAVRAPHRSIWAQNYKRSALPKIVPTIMRLATSGKTVQAQVTPPPAVKRNSSDIVNSSVEDDDVDLLRLYAGNKRPKILPLHGTLQCSRYFGAPQVTKADDNTPTDGDVVTSFLDNLDDCTASSMDSSPPIEEPNSELSPELDLLSQRNDSADFILDNMLIKMNQMNTSGPESGSSQTIDSSLESQSTFSQVSNASNLSHEPSTPKSALRAFQFKMSDSSGNSPKGNGYCSMDTVGTDRSVFFGGSTLLLALNKATPGKLRTGLSRKSKPSPQQSVLARFGFQVKPKINSEPSVTKHS